MKRRRIVGAAALVLAAIVMIAAGLIQVVRVYQHYRTDMLTYESRHLSSIVETSARGMDWMLDGYSMQLSMLMDRREFSIAEDEYAATRDPAVMQRLMSRPDVETLYMGYCVAVYAEHGDFLAATELEYPRNRGTDEECGSGVYLREDEAGDFWFVFVKSSEENLHYELAVKVEQVFSYQGATARVGRSGFLFLVDAEQRMISYASGGQSVTESQSALFERAPYLASSLETVSEEKAPPPDNYIVIRYPWNTIVTDRELSEETLVVTSPLRLGGDSFTMGAVMSFGEFDSFLSGTLHEVTGIILLEIGGALLLFLLAAMILIENRRNAMELEVVREKADLMEEINRQQQSIQHTERLQQLGIMTGGIVHEFNNMLTPIMSQSMLLLEEIDDPNTTQFDYALDIYESSERARDILKKMSEMSKKNLDLDFRVLELRNLLRKMMNLSSMAKDPHIQQELHMPDRELWISGNDQLLTQAFLNLCINASQAMGEEGTLTVSAEEELRSGQRYAQVQVSDTGPGIPEDKISSIYDTFFSTKGEKGTGLGLAICRKIIETHKGTITAANRPEGGAVFTVRIPLVEFPEQE